MRLSPNAAMRRRMILVLIAGATSGALAAPVEPASASPIDAAGYLSYADRIHERLDSRWDERRGYYRAGPGGTMTATNANLLLSHAVAARNDGHGAARNDHRARLILSWLLEGDVWVTRAPSASDDHSHAPGWVSAPGSKGMHLVFDAEVIDALVHAHRARRELALGERTVELIRDRIHRVASGVYWRWPALRLNQINWYSLVYAADAEVTGDRSGLARGLGRQLQRFVARSRPSAGMAGNLGPGLRFHYLPHRPVTHWMNVDSAEYANIVLGFSRFYGQARAAGMSRPGGADLALLHGWVRRALSGYWTHAGYLNWDTGFGFKRWHQAKKLGLTQHALLGIAAAPELQPDPDHGAWAKFIFDRGLELYERLADRAGGIPPGVMFGVDQVAQGAGAARLAAARMAGNAARALDSGMGRRPSATPPGLYAYDPDTGRLAITTPTYSTAIVAVNQGAFPYGGIELARLFDGEQDVAANIGGRAPASFGLVVRDDAGRQLMTTQRGRAALARSVTPLRLTWSPSGGSAGATSHGRRAYAGRFESLRAAGTLRRAGMTAHTRHSFTSQAIVTSWNLQRTERSHISAEVLFPSWGREAKVIGVRADGTVVRLGRSPSALRGIHHFEIRSEDAGYRVTPLRNPAGATARLIRPSRQASAPNPGPTLAIGIGPRSTARQFSFGARIVVAP